MCREGRRVQCFSKSSFQAVNHHQQEKSLDSTKGSSKKEEEDWVPHPRTGIYVPKGHERVMDDVPENAASLSQTYWLRNVDGVEKPDPDISPEQYMRTSLY
ncbi:hypothetical protein Tsubulata_015413 [Turnera subulata]|uniref:Uncharacterized protein n=1 Tax=Turnera subulata TaxID=218843 RepID=A0A9Q0FZ53_9ROSI|nr:hypothetical protein Tsubulata_015413 [Turnera subulata]